MDFTQAQVPFGIEHNQTQHKLRASCIRRVKAKQTQAHLQGRVGHELVARAVLGMEVDWTPRKPKEDAVAGVGVGDVDSRVLQQLLHILQVAADIAAGLQAQPLENDQAVVLPLLIELIQRCLPLLACTVTLEIIPCMCQQTSIERTSHRGVGACMIMHRVESPSRLTSLSAGDRALKRVNALY